jgi:hypothetical protein
MAEWKLATFNVQLYKMKKVIQLAALFTLLLVTVGIYAFATKPSEESCLSKGKLFIDSYVVGKGGARGETGSPAIIIKDNLLSRTILMSYKGKTTRIGSASFGNIRLSYTKTS